MDFTIERIKLLSDRPLTNPELLAEMAYLYNREVNSETAFPIKELSGILKWEISKVAECVSLAIEEQFLVRNREEKGTWKIGNKALRMLRLKGKQFV